MAKNKKKQEKQAQAPEDKNKTRTEAVQSEESPSKKRQPKGDVLALTQIDGKVYNKYGVKSLEELTEERISSKYDTTNVKEYERQLEEKNTADLQRHAASLSVLPRGDRRLLIKLLVKQFQINNSQNLNTAVEIKRNGKVPSQEVMDILSEGR